ncbi:hypothetical protein LSTR_LSTR003330 [Laodelphax striatellus]|uniref:Uncharacterized protein n=1 Tax=Laodelphax striatellus TaxID=195883 RepID=A0A482X5Y5_LAOST|nr:hypothetical protein LSTR_LSTR003330 [Laodelphax striatellus]
MRALIVIAYWIWMLLKWRGEGSRGEEVEEMEEEEEEEEEEKNIQEKEKMTKKLKSGVVDRYGPLHEWCS